MIHVDTESFFAIVLSAAVAAVFVAVVPGRFVPPAVRDVLGPREPATLAFYSATQLPLVVAITTIAVETGHMRTSTAAGLVGAAMLSTLTYPFVGLALRRPSAEASGTGPPGAPIEATAPA